MKKNFIILLIATLIISFILPSYSSTYAEGQNANNQISLDEADVDVLLESSDEETGAIESFSINGNKSEEAVNIDIALETREDQINANMNLEPSNNENNYVNIETINDEGSLTTKQYALEIIELDENKVVAKVIDKVTLEETVVDSTQIQATVIPVIVALIVRAGLKYAIKQYGKKLAMEALIDLGVSEITKEFGGDTKDAKNDKGKVITIDNKKQTIVIRLMEEGSGGRDEAYWKMSVGNKAIDKSGNYNSDADKIHIDLEESSIATIIKHVKKYKK